MTDTPPIDEAYAHLRRALVALSQAEDALVRAGLGREYERMAKLHAQLCKLRDGIWGKQ